MAGTLLLISFSTSAANYYRYKDDNNVTVLGRTIPPQYVHKGYEILNAQGRVMDRIAPALTPAQIKERDERLAAEERRLQADARQKAEDEALRKLYNYPADAARAKKSKMEELDGLIALKRGNIQSLRNQIIDLEEQAANQERSGRSVSQDLLQRLEKLQTQVKDLKAEITKKTEEKRVIGADFDEKISRLEKITGQKLESPAATKTSEEPTQ